MNYRFSILAAVAMLCSLAMTTACTKDDADNFPEGALEIFAEGSGSGTKTTVNGTSVKWVAGDKVWINGNEGTVTQGAGNHWYAAKDGGGDFSTSNDFNSFYPATIATDASASSQTASTATVVFPSHYASSFDGDNQVLSLPMAARSEANATGVKFKHLSAGINVNVKNTFTNDTVLYLDSVSVTSNSVNLCGQASVGLSTGDVPTVSATGTGPNTVTVYFSSPVALAVNAEKCVQVPVIPSSTDLGTVTIRVYTHLAPVAYGSMEVFTFEKNKSSFGALGRNEVKSSPEIGIVRGGANVTPSVKGAFSVSPTTRVIFSQGNLQYVGSTWQFAEHQYDYLGSSQSDGNRDLFGWGTGSNPNQTSTTDADYGTFYDWGNNIGGGWRTLSSEEMNYLLNTRSNTTFNLPNSTSNIRYTKATVNDKNGLILFPDNYVHPTTGVTVTGDYNYNTYNASYSVFAVTSGWDKMEAAGAVFLPAAGYRNGTSAPSEVASHGYYWLSNGYESYKAYRLLFHSGETTASNPQERHYGFSVRLVKEAN